MSIRPWYCCLSLKVVGVDEVVLGFLLQGLGQGGSTELKASMLSRVICILYNAEALRGDGAGAFTIHAVHTCHLWRVWNLGSVNFVSQSSACGGWLGESYFSLSCVVFCTGGGLIRSTCLFHSSQLPVPLIVFCGSIGCMS